MQLLVFIIVYYQFAKPSTKGHTLQFEHHWLRLLSFPLYKIRILNSMVYHVAFPIKPPLPQLNVELVSLLITKSCFGVVCHIELGGRSDNVCMR
jgi:hypothetical protein